MCVTSHSCFAILCSAHESFQESCTRKKVLERQDSCTKISSDRGDIKLLKGNIISAGFPEWFRWRHERKGMKPTIDSVKFYTTGEVLCNFLNDVELENSVVAAFARIH